MDRFAHELSRFWLPGGAHDDVEADGRPAHDFRGDDELEQKALEELAERVSAARSIV